MKVSGKYLLSCFGEMFPLTFIYDTKAENMLFGKVKWTKDKDSTQLINQV